MPDRGASLHEPISIALHGMARRGAARRPPDSRSPILIVGGGILGLAALIALRALYPDNDVTVLVRHAHQVSAAQACGATHIVCGSGLVAFEQFAALLGARMAGAGDNWMLTGGFPYVVEAGGSPSSLTTAFRAVDNRGTVILLGAIGNERIDMTALWYKEAILIGSVDHGRNPQASMGQATPGRDHSIDVALDILAQRRFPEQVLTSIIHAIAA